MKRPALRLEALIGASLILATSAPALAFAQEVDASPSQAPADEATVTVTAPPVRNWALYPEKALESGVEGRAEIDCLIKDDGGLTDCVVVSESPQGSGFGQATIEVMTKYARVDTRQAQYAPGAHFRQVLVWKLQ